MLVGSFDAMDLFSTASTETDISEDLRPESTEPEETVFGKKLDGLEFDQPPTQQDVAWEDLVKSPPLTVVVCSPQEFIVQNTVPGKHLDVQVASVGYQHLALVCADAELLPTGFIRTPQNRAGARSRNRNQVLLRKRRRVQAICPPPKL